MDTIVALSSGRPPAAIAVVRISGPLARHAATVLAGSLPPARQAGLRTLRRDGEPLDRALVLVFDGPATATGEDLIELHCHGGRAVVEAVEAALIAMGSVRRAEPGEFTRRAMANGRIDLAEAEGLADLLSAETEAQRRAAWQGAGGVIGARVRDWVARIAGCAAEIEVRIDYDEEGDVPRAPFDQGTALVSLAAEMRAAIAGPPIERVRDGVRVVVAGPPNAGKSTLVNALADRQIAIVTSIAGTTRDRIEAPVQRGGTAYVLIDTAGLTETTDTVEAIGIGLAHDALAEADIVLWLGEGPPPAHRHLIRVHARADLAERQAPPAGALPVVATTGQGLPELWDAVASLAVGLLPASDALIVTRRQRTLLAEAVADLDAASDCPDLLLQAEHVRRAGEALGQLLGTSATEAMLDALFGRFCLGK